ncbi:MAG: heparinase II/III family protein [Planctomycetota bacterium]|nr:heparinase II/III family protein [Planctomycetota bacterium]
MSIATRVCLAAISSLFISLAATTSAAAPAAAPATQPREWPAVLTIDDFEEGVANWRNEDAGKIEWVDDAPAGKKALRWTAGDDGIGRIILQKLDREKIDFSQYQLLRFHFKTSGKPIWNIDPIVQQDPHAYGFLAHYYAVDTLEGTGRWLLYVQDLSKWENAWPDSFDPARQDFRFEVHQLAGAGRTVLELDHIQLVKNTLDLQRSYRGTWSRQADGSQTTRFSIHLRNKTAQPQTVRCTAIAGSLRKFTCRLPEKPLTLAPGAEGDAVVEVACPAAEATAALPYYGETLQLQVSVDETPGLDLIAELPAGTRPGKLAHPVVLCSPARQAELRRQWADPELRKKMPAWCGVFVGVADKFLDYTPQFPPLAHPGESLCPVDNTALRRIDVPNLPMARHQCPKCGKVYSGPFFDAAAEGWYGQHMKNAQAVRDLGMAYAITGDPKYAAKAAVIFRGYPDVYLKLPIAAASAGSPAYSATSGAVRIGASYMFERIWLTHLAIGLDFIREAHILSDEEVRDITERVLAPSANLMLDHKVGVMNLQGMIDSAGLYAGLAADDPQLVCRALYDSHGILNLMHWGYLPDGNWWENPSYQNVANGVIFPALTTCLNAGIVAFDQRLNNVFKAAYKMYGPDGRSPILGTGGPGTLGYSDNVVHSLAATLDDPQLAWVAHHRPLYLAWSGGTAMYDTTLWAVFNDSTPKIPKDKAVPVLIDQSVNFPDYGAQVLRVPGTDAYAYIHYGRTLVHGHYDKLSINAYGKGGWYAGNVMGGYGHRFKEYLEATSGSSTVMVDGKSQDADTGTLLFQKSTPLGELASAREEGAWKDVEHERTLALTSAGLIVIDRCASETEHTYDWLWHGSATGLQFGADQAEGEEVKSLGEAACYPFFLPAASVKHTGDAARIVYERPKAQTGAALSFCGLASDQAQLIRTKNEGTHEGLILRKRGKTVAFACVMEPLGKGERPVASIEPIEALDAATGKPVGLDRAQAYRVGTAEGRLIVIVNYGKEKVKTRGEPAVESTDRVTIAKER